MRIGILTLPLNDNYGGILQAYALQKYLVDRGHEAILIDRRFNKKLSAPISNIIKKLFFPGKIKKNQENEKIRRHVADFIDRYIQPKSEQFFSSGSIMKRIGNYNFDAIVVGSDQVWRPDYIRNMTTNYFLDFAQKKSILKLSYAASFGKDSWEEEPQTTSQVKNLLNKFDGISVREDTGIEICATTFGVESVQHIDPTLLLTLQDYEYLVENENEPEREENLLVYMLDINADKQQVIDRIGNEINGTPFSINKPIVEGEASVEEKTYPTVTNWLKGFFDAKFVITDSFHGTIFSLLHNKPFVVYGNEKRGLTRFYSMLKKMKLENRIILNSDELTEDVLKQKIDWDYVNNVLREERSKSDSYFKELGI